jgi:hypothetical protein
MWRHEACHSKPYLINLEKSTRCVNTYSMKAAEILLYTVENIIEFLNVINLHFHSQRNTVSYFFLYFKYTQ